MAVQAESRDCRHCAAPLKAGQQVYCSHRCHNDARRTAVERICRRCSKPFTVLLAAIRQGGGVYCTVACYRLAKATTPAVVVCEQCGTEKAWPGHSPPGRYCSQQCFGLASRKQVQVECQVCGKAFALHPYRLREGTGLYCSNACRHIGRRRTVQLDCARCGQRFASTPSEVRAGRRYCRRACFFIGSEVGERDITCQQCGGTRRVYASRAARGQKYCSMACYEQTWKPHRLSIRCAYCHTTFEVVLSRRGKARFCSRRCFGLASRIRTRTRTCRVCRERFTFRAWRRRRFCSHACANRGRPAATWEAARDRRILELRTEGLKAPAIGERLGAENSAWWTSAAAIRKVISRKGSLVKAR